jgi:hypothetical protein
MPRYLAGLLAAALLAAVPGSPGAAQEIDTLALRAHTHFLAHDLLEGRGTGTRGERIAALYLTSQLKQLGIPGAGAGGAYLQQVPLRKVRIDAVATRLSVSRQGQTAGFRHGDHFILSTGGAAAFRDMAGQALFAGTAGLAAAALERYPRLDGRVIVLLGGLGADARDLIPDWTARGAEGVVLLLTAADDYDLFVRSRGPDRLYVAAALDDPVWQPDLPVLMAGPRLSAAILEEAPLAPDALSGRRPFAALELERSLRLELAATVEPLAAANVAALLPGSDPALRDEVVIFTAHYDHLGIGVPDATGDTIYNGFSDNAAGTAMVLAIARELRRSPPARSVLFLFLTGEERGLLGSSYYAVAPLIPLARTHAVINLDAGAPAAPPVSWRVSGGAGTPLGVLARRVAAERGWTATLTSASANSDHWPFIQRGVPAVFLIPGAEWEGHSAAEQQALHRRWDQYHRPGDEWHPDFPFAGLQRYADYALALGRAAANASTSLRAEP